MADNKLLIEINANAANAKKEFDNLRDKTEDLEKTLNKVALVSAAAFAAFSAEVYVSVKAFEEAQAASVQLNNALQNQGIYTKELAGKYTEYAEAVQAATGIDDDAIKKSQGIAQSYLGQTEITLDLTKAIADLGASMGGDLNSAAEKIARTIGTGTNAFARQGLVISEGATQAERYAKVLEFVQLKAGGLAEELNKADGYSKALTTAFGNFQESIGARFEPVVSAARKALVNLFQYMADNPVIADLAAAFITAGAAVAGIIAVVAGLTPVFLALSAAATTLELSMSAAFLGIPLLVGAIVAGVTLLYLNWDKSMAGMKAAAVGFVSIVSELFSGFGVLLSGVFDMNPEKVKKGWEQITGAYKKGKDDTVATFQEITEANKVEGEKQNEDKKRFADIEAARKREQQALLTAIEKNSLELIQLQNENASAEIITLKGKEIETLKALEKEQGTAQREALRERLDIIHDLQADAQAQDQERELSFQNTLNETKLELQRQGIDASAALTDQKLAELRAQGATEVDIDRQVQEEVIQRHQAADKQKLLDKKKYGEAYAALNKIMGSEEVKGASEAANALVALQGSKNDTLKAIGKAAAVTQILVDTPVAAMAAFRGLNTALPFLAPAIGFAGAAAVTAYGAERVSNVLAAADGGLVQGGTPGKDSVPALLMPGELVVPTKNFDQVVGAVQKDSGSNDNAETVALLRSIDQKFSNPQTNIIQGDVMSDDSFIDALVRRISDALEFRNAKLAGVNI